MVAKVWPKPPHFSCLQKFWDFSALSTGDSTRAHHGGGLMAQHGASLGHTA